MQGCCGGPNCILGGGLGTTVEASLLLCTRGGLLLLEDEVGTKLEANAGDLGPGVLVWEDCEYGRVVIDG